MTSGTICNECGGDLYEPERDHEKVCQAFVKAKKKHGPILFSYSEREKAKCDAHTRLFHAGSAVEKGEAYKSLLWVYFSRSVVSWGERADVHPDFKLFAEVMVHNDLDAGYVDKDMIAALDEALSPRASDKMKEGAFYWERR